MAAQYQIRVKEQLDPRLSVWFDDFVISHTPDGDTLLTGTVVDQAALYGLVARCRDHGLTLISIHLQSNDRTASRTERGKRQGDSHEHDPR